MRKVEIRAPAKINLFLEVLPRPEGARLHPVDTIIEKVDLFDELTLELTSGRVELSCSEPQLENTGNLAYRAACLLKETCRVGDGATIRLLKRIPVAAGLGGGSSDAAVVLLALNRLWRIDKPIAELLPLALQLGSDVPCFLVPGRCRAAGFGEQITLLPVQRKFQYLIVPTGVSISTALAYQWLDDLTYTPYSSKIILNALQQDEPDSIAKAVFNRFGEVVAVRDAQLKNWQRKLAENFEYSFLAGSGGAFFVFLTRPDFAPESGKTGGLQFLPVSTYQEVLWK